MQGAWAWARAEIRRRWPGLLAVGILIGLLAAFAMTAMAGARRTASSYDRFRAATLAHDVLITAPDADALQRVTRLPGVEAASVGTIYPAFIDLESEFDLGVLATTDGNLGRTIDVGAAVRGRWPRVDRTNEVALSPQAAKTLRAGPGDEVTLGTLTPEQQRQIFSEDGAFSGRLEGPRLRFTVTGVVRNAEDLRGDEASHILYATPAFHRAYADRVGRFVDFAAVRLAAGRSAHDRFATDAREILGTEGEVSLVGTHEVDQSVQDSLRVLTVGLAALGLAALAVGLVAGSQALGRQAWLAATDQPALGALGMTRRTRALAVALGTVPAAAVAAAVAGVAALAASPLTPISFGRTTEPDPGVAFDPLVHLGGASLVAALVVGTGLLAGWQVADPAVEQDPRARPSLASRLSRALNLGPSAVTGVRMALERGRGRAGLPVRSALVAAVVAVGGLAGTATFAASLDRLTTTPARYGSPWDLQPDLYEDDFERAARLPVVGAMGVMARAGVEIVDGPAATGYAMRKIKGEISYTVLDGRMPLADDEAAVGRDQLERLDIGLGDTIRLRTEGAPRRLRVVGTVLTPSTDQDPVASGVVVTMPVLEAAARSDVTPMAAIRWRPGVDRAEATQAFRKAFPYSFSRYAAPRPPGEVTNLSRVGSLPDAFGAFLAAVGVAGLLHALVTSARRRRQDLAVLRAMGFVRRQLAASVVWQSMTIAVVGLVVGVPLGIAVGRWVWIVLADGIGVGRDPLVPALTATLLVPLTVVAANLVALPLGILAARTSPAAVLRTE